MGRAELKSYRNVRRDRPSGFVLFFWVRILWPSIGDRRLHKSFCLPYSVDIAAAVGILSSESYYIYERSNRRN